MQRQHHHAIELEALRDRIARLEGARRQRTLQDGRAETTISTGCGPLDRLLPQRGFRHGTLVEWLAEQPGSGVETLAVVAACEACRQRGALVVVDHRREFHPPAAVRWGIELQQLILVHAVGPADNVWALDQALRCPGVAATLAWPERLDGKTFRRLQLAVEQGGGLGLLVRPGSVRQEPSWADVRLLIEPLPPPAGKPTGARRLRIHLLRCRGGVDGRSVDVEIDDETCTVYLAAQLADPTARPRAAGA